MHITSSLETRNTKFLLNICVPKKKALGNENVSQALPMYNVYYSEETFEPVFSKSGKGLWQRMVQKNRANA